jgi:hypothetical protein
MSARDRFNGIAAKFWDCTDPEVLEYLDPISALEACVENHREPDRPTEEVIREMGTITVSAYTVCKYTPTEITEAAERALDAATEALDDEEHGHPDGDQPVFAVDVLAKHLPAFEAAIVALIADGKVWQCEVTATVELAPDETLEILLSERPEWFGAAPPAPAPEVPA